jgi:hypothetical protein
LERPCDPTNPVPVKAGPAQTLLRLDQQDNPHLYDRNRRYLPEHQPLQLLPDHDFAATSPSYDSLTTKRDDFDLLSAALDGATIAIASQLILFLRVHQYTCGSITSAYRLAVINGLTPREAQNRAATAAHLALIDYTNNYSHFNL